VAPVGAVLPDTELRATKSAVIIRNANGASNPNEEFFGNGSE